MCCCCLWLLVMMVWIQSIEYFTNGIFEDGQPTGTWHVVENKLFFEIITIKIYDMQNLHCCWDSTQSLPVKLANSLIFRVCDMILNCLWMWSHGKEFKMTSLKWYSTCAHSLHVRLTLWLIFDGEDVVHCIFECVMKEMHARFYVFKEMNHLNTNVYQ